MTVLRVVACFNAESPCPFVEEVFYDSCSLENCGHPEAPSGKGLSIFPAGEPPDWCPLRVADAIVRLEK